MVVTFANSNATYVAIGMNANTYAYNTNATYLMNVHAVRGVNTSVSLYPDGRLKINTSTNSGELLTVYNNNSVVLSQNADKLVTNVNTVITDTLYVSSYAEGSQYIVADSGTITLDLNRATKFYIDAANHTMTELVIIKPNAFVANRNRSLSCMLTFINTANISYTFWTSAGVVWPYGRKPPDPVCAKLYSLLYVPNFPYNWFGFTTAGSANTANGGGGGEIVTESYWITMFDPSRYLGYDSGDLQLDLIIDTTSNNIYLGGRTDDTYNTPETANTQVIKFNIDTGSVMWQRDIGGANFDEDVLFRNLPIDSTGNVYALYARGNDYESPFATSGLTKFNSSGEVVWQKGAIANTVVEPELIFPPYNNYVPAGAVVDSNDNIYIPLWIWSNSPGYNGLGFAKLSNTGTLIESTVYEIKWEDNPYQVEWFVYPLSAAAITSNNEVVQPRYFELAAGAEDEGPSGIVILKTDPNATTLDWTKAILDSSTSETLNPTDCVVDSTDSIYISINNTNTTGRVVKLNRLGEVIFSKNFIDPIITIDVDQNNNLYAVDWSGNIYCLSPSGTVLWKNILYVATLNKFADPEKIVVSKNSKDFLVLKGKVYDNVTYETQDFIIKLSKNGDIPGGGTYTINDIEFKYEVSNEDVTNGTDTSSDFNTFYEDTGLLPNYGPIIDDNAPVANANYTGITLTLSA